MLVRISDKGFEILDDKVLANKVLFAIMGDKESFINGKPIIIKDEHLSVEMVTSIKDDTAQHGKKKDKAMA